MRLFDMHCDTLYRAYTEKSSLYNDSFHISFTKTKNISPYIQCLAVWIPDEYRGMAAWELFCGCVELLHEQIDNTDIIWCRTAQDIKAAAEQKKQGIILTVESAAVLGGDIEKVKLLHDMGVRMITLTWNGRNELGDGIMEPDDMGLSSFGRDVLKEMEKTGIIADISHAGEKMFSDVLELARKPFVASHSDMRSVTGHRRNLTDWQFKKLIAIGGLAGLNFCADFLRRNNETQDCQILHPNGMYDIIEHTGYMLSLGGKANIAMGADFDGAELPEGITGIECMEELHELFIQQFGQEITEAVFFGNAYRFFTENMI